MKKRLKIDLQELVSQLTTKDNLIYDYAYKANCVGTILALTKTFQDTHVLAAKIFVTDEAINIQTPRQSGRSTICKWEDPEAIFKINNAILAFINFQ